SLTDKSSPKTPFDSPEVRAEGHERARHEAGESNGGGGGIRTPTGRSPRLLRACKALKGSEFAAPSSGGLGPPDRSRAISVLLEISQSARCPLYHLGALTLPRTPSPLWVQIPSSNQNAAPTLRADAP